MPSWLILVVLIGVLGPIGMIVGWIAMGVVESWRECFDETLTPPEPPTEPGASYDW